MSNVYVFNPFTGTLDVVPSGSVFNPGAVAITGGSITGITDLAVTDGGTGASTAAAALTALGAASILMAVQNKTSTYTVIATDAGSVINCTSGTFSVNLTAAASLGAGFHCYIWNTSATSTHVVTIDPNASETIDGLATIVLYRGQGCQIECDGTGWSIVSRRGLRGYSENIGPTAVRPTAGGDGSIALGANSNNIGIRALTFGDGSYSNSTDTVTMGLYSATTAASAFCLGDNSTAAGSYSLAMGFQSLATQYGKRAHASGYFTGQGDAQSGKILLRKATTDATPVVLTSNAGAAGATNQCALSADQAMLVRGSVIARRSVAGADTVSAWAFTAVFRQGANAAATALVGSVSYTLIAQDAGLSACAVAVTADTTNGAIAVTVTGIAATNIRWLAELETLEVVYA